MNTSRRGQSIVEAMVAISILTTGFLGIFTLLSRSFFLSRVIANETMATYLASEGMEITKNLIDHDVYIGLANGTSQWGNCCAPGTYRVDYASMSLAPYLSPVGSPEYLQFDPTNFRYGYAGSAATPFNRWVVIAAPGPDEIQVNVIVQWSTGSFTSQNINLEDRFYNWHP